MARGSRASRSRVGQVQLHAPLPAQAKSVDRWRDTVKHQLEETFGFSGFQGKQEEAILAVLSGRDVFVLMPTGGGKSLCYCLPALVKPGVALVVSPLIALMQNQVEGFRQRGIACGYLCSSQGAAERGAVLADLRSGAPALKLLYVTPEGLATEGFLEVVRGLQRAGLISLLAVDEAHCISSWGHDFRPKYRQLGRLKSELAGVPCIALTATAAAQVQSDIVTQLRLRDPVQLVASFNRPNIHYHIVLADFLPGQERLPHIIGLLEELRAADGVEEYPCSIIYTLRRETADEVAAMLKRKGVPAAAYHAGLKGDRRAAVLADWSCGRVPVVAATIAFGMGIDRACVRLVIHYNLPKTLEGFYQESGRAGRDGLSARSVLFYSINDRNCMEYLIQKTKKRKRGAATAGMAHPDGAEPNAVAALRGFGEVVRYCTAQACRRVLVLKHFGESFSAASCTGCDFCTDPQGVALQLSKLERKAVEVAEQRSARFSYGPRLSFGRTRRSSTCDWNDENSGEASSGSFERSSIDDPELAEARSALRKVQASGHGGEEQVFDELLQAERRSNAAAPSPLRKSGKQSKLRAKLECLGASKLEGPAKPQTSAAAVDDSGRQRAREHLLKQLESNGALRLLAPQAEIAAQALEAECFACSTSRQVYRSKLSNAARLAASAADLEQLPAVLEALQNDIANAGDPSAAAHSVIPTNSALPMRSELPSASVHQDNSSTCHSSQLASAEPQTGQPLVKEFEYVASSIAAGQEEAALASLAKLARCSVTAAILRSTGLGKRVKQLKKCGTAKVAAAAEHVVQTWKQMITKG